MAVDSILDDLERRLQDPHSRTPSMSFNEGEIKKYTDLFKNGKEYSSKTWQPASSNPTNIPSRPTGDVLKFKKKNIDSTKERRKLEERLKSYNVNRNKKIQTTKKTNDLYQQAAAINRKRENLRIQQQKAEKNLLCSPYISPKSRVMAKERSGRIEDRLIAQGAVSKMIAEEELRQQSQQQRKPKINVYGNSLQIDKPVVERLMLYSKIYSEKHKNEAEKPLEFTFSPKINNYSGSSSRASLYSPKLQKSQEIDFSFKPELDKNSLKIASKLGSFGERSSSHTKSISVETHSFKPAINKTENLSTLNSSSPRWQHLYSLNIERRERLEMLRKAFKENDRDFECTFQPKTCRAPSSLSRSGTVKRLHDWESRRLAKIHAARDSSCDKEMDECTFTPSLYENLAGQTTLSDFYIELEKKKKNTYTQIHKGKFNSDRIEWRSEKVAPLFISDINSNEYDDAIKELHDLLHVGLSK